MTTSVRDPHVILRDYLLAQADIGTLCSDRVFVGRLTAPEAPLTLKDNTPCIWFAQQGGRYRDASPILEANFAFRCVATDLKIVQDLVDILRQVFQAKIGGTYEQAAGLLSMKHVSGPTFIPSYEDDPTLRELEGMVVTYAAAIEVGRHV